MREYWERLSAIRVHWNKIEKRIKEAEQLRHETVVSAINELRYAGRRIVDILAILVKGKISEADSKELEEHFTAAKIYLVNADHDVTDSVCFFVHEKIHVISNKYEVDVICKYIPGFLQFLTKIDEANQIVSVSREERINRMADYERLEKEYIPDLIPLYKTLVRSEVVALAAEKKKRFLGRLVVIASLTLAVVAIMIAVLEAPDIYDGWTRPLLVQMHALSPPK